MREFKSALLEQFCAVILRVATLYRVVSKRSVILKIDNSAGGAIDTCTNDWYFDIF